MGPRDGGERHASAARSCRPGDGSGQGHGSPAWRLSENELIEFDCDRVFYNYKQIYLFSAMKWPVKNRSTSCHEIRVSKAQRVCLGRGLCRPVRLLNFESDAHLQEDRRRWEWVVALPVIASGFEKQYHAIEATKTGECVLQAVIFDAHGRHHCNLLQHAVYGPALAVKKGQCRMIGKGASVKGK